MHIIHTGQRIWTNRHENVTQQVTEIYDLANQNSGNVLADYNDARAGVQGIFTEAISRGIRLRALGGEWSWTRIACTDGLLLNTKPLNLTFTISQASVHNAYPHTPDDLYFAQCGTSVKELSDRLFNHGRSIKTSGASNGQTIAGAIATGTHGAAIDVGSISDYVVGLHLVLSPSKHIWLERASYPVVNESFLSNLQTVRVADDEQFNAALVSFGSMGFVMGVMIETAPLFLYETHRVKLQPDADLLSLMTSLDFTNSAMPHGSERPYYFQSLINPYDKKKDFYFNIMYKRPYQTGYTPPSVAAKGIGIGDDAPVFIGTIGQAIPKLVPALVNTLLKDQYKTFSKVMGTHREVFTNFTTHGKVLSTAIGIPLDEVIKVKDLLLEVNKTSGPFVGVFAFRYVKVTKATLGFQKFPFTCVVELDGVFSRQTLEFYEAVWKALEDLNIPHALHWGKLNNYSLSKIRKCYGDAATDSWIMSRNKLLNDPASRNLFTNDLLVSWGLDAVLV
jgi:hypothetical protein